MQFSGRALRHCRFTVSLCSRRECGNQSQAELHERLILYRDLKPPNVSHQQPASRVGSPVYCAPEFFEGELHGEKGRHVLFRSSRVPAHAWSHTTLGRRQLGCFVRRVVTATVIVLGRSQRGPLSRLSFLVVDSGLHTDADPTSHRVRLARRVCVKSPTTSSFLSPRSSVSSVLKYANAPGLHWGAEGTWRYAACCTPYNRCCHFVPCAATVH